MSQWADLVIGTEREPDGDRAPLAAADQRREQMLRAALDVIAERGYPDTRIADVAERAGTSPALVIYYFKTKDQLLTEAIRYSEDGWYREGLRRIAALPTAALRLEELVAMNCLPEEDPDPRGWALLWLDLWAQAARNPGLAATRQRTDERWRQAIESLVREGQAAGEFGDVDPADFAATLSAMLDGFAIQIALHDPVLVPERAFELGMRFASDLLGFDWKPGRRAQRAAS